VQMKERFAPSLIDRALALAVEAHEGHRSGGTADDPPGRRPEHPGLARDEARTSPSRRQLARSARGSAMIRGAGRAVAGRLRVAQERIR
jgi:hypothetical protein